MLAWLALVPTAVHAQEGPTAEPIEQIIVTGSRMPRADFFSVSPIVTLDRTEMELAGTTEIRRLLNDLPQVDPAVDAGTSNAFGGESFVNLRALGSNRTLVLLNGRRYPSQGNNGSVDVNALPPAVIERVEIITGGASAVYGSDAMAGAINFVLRDDFEGLESRLQYGVTDHGDADTWQLDVAWGTPFAGGRGHVTLVGDYLRRDEVFQDARSFSRTPIISDDTTGELVEFGTFATPAGAVAGFGLLHTFEADGTPRPFVEPDDRVSLAAYNPLLTAMERYSSHVFGRYELADDLSARVEMTLARSMPESKVGDQFLDFVTINTARPDITPDFRQLLSSFADPDGDGLATVFMGRTFSPERGTGSVEYTAEFYRLLLALEGSVNDEWHWGADVSFAENERDTVALNDLSISRIRQGQLVDPATSACFDTSNGCVPVNPFGAGNLTVAAAEFIGLPGSGFTETSRETYATVNLRGSPWRVPAGRVDVAFGAEYREFDFENSFPNDNLQSGDSLFFGAGINPLAGTISVGEAYAEARVPVFGDTRSDRLLSIEAGVRVSDYDTLNDTVWTWKLGGEWQVNEQWRLRAMRQRAIRAPGMSELFSGSNRRLTDTELGVRYDECSASRDPVGNGLADLCIAQGIPPSEIGVYEASIFPTAVSVATNPDLEPEEADTFSAGVVWQLPRASMSVDYFDIEINEALGTADHIDLVQLCFLSRDPNSQACRSFTRAPSGDIDTAVITTINTAVLVSEGIDLALSADWEPESPVLFGDSASISLSILVTHYLEAASQGSALLPLLDCAGKFGGFCNLFSYQGAVPDWRATTRLTYRSGPVSASLRWRYIGSMTNAEAERREIRGEPPGILAVPEVSAVSYIDLTGQWDVTDTFYVTIGVDNLFDKEPPLLGSAARDANTDPTTYDVLGRRYFLRVTLGLGE